MEGDLPTPMHMKEASPPPPTPLASPCSLFPFPTTYQTTGAGQAFGRPFPREKAVETGKGLPGRYFYHTYHIPFFKFSLFLPTFLLCSFPLYHHFTYRWSSVDVLGKAGGRLHCFHLPTWNTYARTAHCFRFTCTPCTVSLPPGTLFHL